MLNYLKATWLNPRWWVVLPFTVFVMLPLIVLQMIARLVAFMARSVDEGIEEIGGTINKPVHNWWKRDVQRLRAAARVREAG